jgi:hypothetical protein
VRTLVLEAFKGSRSSRGQRIRRLCSALTASANARDVEVAIYSRRDIEKALGLASPATREAVAGRVASFIENFAWRLPPERRAWESEDPRLSLFNAAALALSYYQRKGQIDFAE